jgi:uncharacterized protein (DUF433 family)
VDTKHFNFPDTVPLVQWENGTIRVRGSRVTLDTIVHKMEMGDSVERIHRGFPTVSVKQIKEILAWYFANKVEADEYLREQEATGDYIRKTIESTPEYRAFREEFLRRKAEFRKN